MVFTTSSWSRVAFRSKSSGAFCCEATMVGRCEEILKLDESCSVNPKSEILDWTGSKHSWKLGQSNLRFRISDLRCAKRKRDSAQPQTRIRPISKFPRLPCCLLVVLLSFFTTLEAQTPRISLVPVLSGLSQPLFLTSAKDGSNRRFIVEQIGRIRVLQPGATS